MPERDNLFGLGGACVWITGAGRGIGLACARRFTAQGARVVGIDVEFSAQSREVFEAVHVNVTDFLAVGRASVALVERGLAPTALVNNAGITRDGVVWKLSEADWDTVLSVNLRGAFNFIHHVTPFLRAAAQRQPSRDAAAGTSGEGRGEIAGPCIVNVTSINGLRGKFGQSNYCAAKAGLIGLTKACARELGHFGIRVNAVAPGMVETGMTRELPEQAVQTALAESLLDRLAAPEDVADAVLFLTSRLSRHVTGQVLQVDGGQLL